MRKISRVSLYKNTLNFIENKEFRNIKFLTEYFKNKRETLDDLLKFNIYILDGIENYFLISDDFSIHIFELSKIYSNKINNIINFQLYTEILSHSDIKRMKSIVSNEYNNGRDKDIYYLFNSIINVLNDINNRVLDRIKMKNDYRLRDSDLFVKKIKNKVFLSHAFDDKLYTLSLFIFMFEENILLYVDWMFSSEFDNGEQIKENLFEKILDSNQLLFLRTVNSELSIRGSGNIRGWCSWELGTFYSIKNKCEKFYIELYKSKKIRKRNKQLDGIKPLKDIIAGRLL